MISLSRRLTTSSDSSTRPLVQRLLKNPPPLTPQWPPDLPPYVPEVHHSWLRLIRRRATSSARLGRLQSEQSQEPPPPDLVSGGAPCQRGRHPHPGRYITRSARAAARR